MKDQKPAQLTPGQQIQVKRIATCIIENERHLCCYPDYAVNSHPLTDRSTMDIYDEFVKPIAKYGGVKFMPRWGWDDNLWDLVKAEIATREGINHNPRKITMDTLDQGVIEAARSYRVIMSVMGPHAGEDAAAIFKRKGDDITSAGRTYWLVRSPDIRQETVQKWARDRGDTWVIFLEPSAAGGAKPTTTATAARQVFDGQAWADLDPRVGPVTGKLDGAASAMVIDRLITEVPGYFDLWNYAPADDKTQAVRFMLGRSTIRAIRRWDGAKKKPGAMASRYRRIAAVGRLAEPFVVKVR